MNVNDATFIFVFGWKLLRNQTNICELLHRAISCNLEVNTRTVRESRYFVIFCMGNVSLFVYNIETTFSVVKVPTRLWSPTQLYRLKLCQNIRFFTIHWKNIHVYIHSMLKWFHKKDEFYGVISTCTIENYSSPVKSRQKTKLSQTIELFWSV